MSTFTIEPTENIVISEGGRGPAGPAGQDGLPGNKITTGTVAPTTNGVTAGDIYINTTTGDMYVWQ